MGRKYKNPPIVEALCEFQFMPGQPWDMTMPGLIYEKVKDKFPDRKQQIGIDFQFRQTEKGIENKFVPAPPRIQFHKKDKTALIQVAPDMLAVNQLKPYPVWENFKKMIIDNFHVYKEIANPKGLKRMGLRYINVFDFDKTQVKLTDYFEYYPMIPKTLPHDYGDFLTTVKFSFKNNSETLILSLATRIPTKPVKPDTTSVALDIDYAAIKPEYIAFDSVENWMERAHERIENEFEACITDKTRRTFEEVRL